LASRIAVESPAMPPPMIAAVRPRRRRDRSRVRLLRARPRSELSPGNPGLVSDSRESDSRGRGRWQSAAEGIAADCLPYERHRPPALALVDQLGIAPPQGPWP